MNYLQQHKNNTNEIRCWAIQNKEEMNRQIEHNNFRLEVLAPKSDYDFAGGSLYKQKWEIYDIT